MNHSCDSNAYIKAINNDRHILALRNIKKGEEITFDYAINSTNLEDWFAKQFSGELEKLRKVLK